MKISVSKKFFLIMILQTFLVCTIANIMIDAVLERRVTETVEDQLYTTSYLLLDAFSVSDEIGSILSDFHEKTDIDVILYDNESSQMSSIESLEKIPLEYSIIKLISNGDGYFAKNIAIAGSTYYGYYLPFLNESGELEGVVFTGIHKEKVMENVSKGVTVITIALILLCAIFIGAASIAILSIVKSIKRLKYTVATLTDNDVSVDHELYDYERDDLQELCNKTALFSKALNRALNAIKDTLELLHTASVDLDKSSELTNDAATEIANAIEEITAGANIQAVETANATEKIGIIADKLNKIGISVNELEDIAREMDEIKNKTMKMINDLNSANIDIVKKVNSTNEQIAITSDSVKKIGEAVNVIKNIASQTKLLSLNASIEAARAGEQGKGFSVVASNIGTLASQSAESSDVIEKILKDLTKNYTLIEENMKATTANVEIQSEKISDTYTMFNTLEKNVSSTVKSVNNVDDMVEHINVQIIDIVDIISNLSATSEENSASTQETMASVEEQTASIEEIHEKAVMLEEIANTLLKEIDVFKTK